MRVSVLNLGCYPLAVECHARCYEDLLLFELLERTERYSHTRRNESTRCLYVYLWVDGVHFGVRLEDASQCILVVIGATADGKT